MGEFVLPKHVNVLQMPEIEDGFTTLPLEVASKLSRTAIDFAFSRASYSGPDIYAKSVVGSEDLALFYQRLNQVFALHYENSDSERSHPLAVVANDGKDVFLSRLIRTASDSDFASPAHMQAETSKQDSKVPTYGVTLNYRFGANNKAFRYPYQENGVEAIEAEEQNLCVWDVRGSRWLEITEWDLSGEEALVRRRPFFDAIAVGAPAVEAVLEAHTADWSEAYERLMDGVRTRS